MGLNKATNKEFSTENSNKMRKLTTSDSSQNKKLNSVSGQTMDTYDSNIETCHKKRQHLQTKPNAKCYSSDEPSHTIHTLLNSQNNSQVNQCNDQSASSVGTFQSSASQGKVSIAVEHGKDALMASDVNHNKEPLAVSSHDNEHFAINPLSVCVEDESVQYEKLNDITSKGTNNEFGCGDTKGLTETFQKSAVLMSNEFNASANNNNNPSSFIYGASISSNLSDITTFSSIDDKECVVQHRYSGKFTSTCDPYVTSGHCVDAVSDSKNDKKESNRENGGLSDVNYDHDAIAINETQNNIHSNMSEARLKNNFNVSICNNKKTESHSKSAIPQIQFGNDKAIGKSTSSTDNKMTTTTMEDDTTQDRGDVTSLSDTLDRGDVRSLSTLDRGDVTSLSDTLDRGDVTSLSTLDRGDVTSLSDEVFGGNDAELEACWQECIEAYRQFSCSDMPIGDGSISDRSSSNSPTSMSSVNTDLSA